MAEFYMQKGLGGHFDCISEEGVEYANRIKVGTVVLVNVRVPQNARFHRKLMALLRFAYDAWEPIAEGAGWQKSFKRFRDDLIILAGYYQDVVDLEGDIRMEAQSLAYDECSAELKEQIYSDVLDVISSHVFSGKYSPEKLDELTERWVGFL